MIALIVGGDSGLVLEIWKAELKDYMWRVRNIG